MGLHRAVTGLALVALAASPSAPGGEVVVGEEIFGSQEAAALVMQARTYDPAFAGAARADRGKAIGLYEEAIARQPGARINAPLANRVAQLYAFPYDPGRGIHPDRQKAAWWWRRCIRETHPRQLLWAEAHMGLGCTTFLAGKPQEAVAAFKTILDLDAQNVEWPDWRVRPDTKLEDGRRYLDEEMSRIRADAERIKLTAVDKIHYVLVRVDGAAALSTLLEVAKQHEGTPTATHARQLVEKALRESRVSLYRYRELSPVSPDIPFERARGSPSEGMSDRAVTDTKDLTALAGEAAKLAPEPPERTSPAEAATKRSGPTVTGVTLLLGAGASVLVVVAVLLLRRALAARRGS